MIIKYKKFQEAINLLREKHGNSPEVEAAQRELDALIESDKNTTKNSESQSPISKSDRLKKLFPVIRLISRLALEYIDDVKEILHPLLEWISKDE